MKLICFEDPNLDYQTWIFESTGLEVSRLPIEIGKEYKVIGNHLEGRCLGKTQSYCYLYELSEVGKIPTKYFRPTCESRNLILNNIINDK